MVARGGLAEAARPHQSSVRPSRSHAAVIAPALPMTHQLLARDHQIIAAVGIALTPPVAVNVLKARSRFSGAAMVLTNDGGCTFVFLFNWIHCTSDMQLIQL